jgi:hypothetical protein
MAHDETPTNKAKSAWDLNDLAQNSRLSPASGAQPSIL